MIRIDAVSKRLGSLSRVICALAVAASLCISVPALAQGPPGTDIYLVEVQTTPQGLSFGKPVNVTDRDGYDNQPSFLPDGRALLYTSNRGGQTDIYRYDIATGTTTQVTYTTPESEYSPTVTPDANWFSVVRVEADSTQRLWEFPLSGGEPQLVLQDVKPVGYHAWGDGTTLGLFVLGNPSTFQVANTETGESEIVAYTIGRSMHKVPGRHAISFTHRVSDNALVIKQLDLRTQAIRPLVKLLDGSEFYAWTPDGAVLMGHGSKLYHWHPDTSGEWTEVVDFEVAGVTGISRLAVSPQGDWVAVVGARGGG